MYEIVVISGKGGAGKSSVCAALAHVSAGQAVLCDLDVDAPDLHIILEPQDGPATPFMSGNQAVIAAERCTDCGLCASLCRFGAVTRGPSGPVVDGIACEGCGVCVALCPAHAIDFPEQHCGEWMTGQSRFGDFVHARLFPGEENSGKLIALLKREARALAKATGKAFILHDGSPGIGCPVISSLSGARLAVAVAESTPSGRHDFERVAALCRHFRIPVSVIINKADLNPAATRELRDCIRAEGHDLLGELPFSTTISQAMLRKKAFTETSPALHDDMAGMWNRIASRAQENTRPR